MTYDKTRFYFSFQPIAHWGMVEVPHETAKELFCIYRFPHSSFFIEPKTRDVGRSFENLMMWG